MRNSFKRYWKYLPQRTSFQGTFDKVFNEQSRPSVPDIPIGQEWDECVVITEILCRRELSNSVP